MKKYFYDKFKYQLASLTFSRPCNVVREHIMNDDSVVFFGGQDWENVQTDLARIPQSDRSKFILALFMVVITDQCLYTHFRQTYQSWRQMTTFPKFGWSGYGPHNENPFKIIWAPERDNVIDSAQVLSMLPDFVAFMKSETETFFKKNLPTVPVTAFFNAIKNDAAYSFSEGSIIQKIKELI